VPGDVETVSSVAFAQVFVGGVLHVTFAHGLTGASVSASVVTTTSSPASPVAPATPDTPAVPPSTSDDFAHDDA
jgi:hypothetical protein